MSQVWHRRISQAAQAAAFPEKIQDVFALAHNAWAKEMHFEELGKINKDVFLQHGCSIYYFRKKNEICETVMYKQKASIIVS